jgi:hypothetical protein
MRSRSTRARPAATALACVALLAAAAPARDARADDDELLTSIYTENGYELRRDERVFVLLGAFNLAGFDRADQARALPFPRLVLHPVREKIRAALPADAKLRRNVDSFLDTHPQPVEAYVAAALALGDAPAFAPGAGFPAELAGLDRLLADVLRDAKLAKVGRSLATDERGELKRLRGEVDAPFGALRAAFGLKEEDAPALALMPTPLDSPELAVARRLADGTHAVVFGLSLPDRPLDLKPALRAYAALLAREAARGVALEPVAEAVTALRAAGVAAPDARELVEESLRAAVAAKLWSADAPGEVEAAFKRGLVLARDFLKALTDPPDPEDKRPLVERVVAKADLKKAVAEFAKPPATPPPPARK